jgi:hypothetical protein
MYRMSPTVSAVVKEVLLSNATADHDHPVHILAIDDPRHFGISAQILIGPDDSPRADSFDLWVCSPSWLAGQVQAGWWTSQFRPAAAHTMPDAVVPGAGIWLMREWDRNAFEHALHELCARASPAPDWGSVASRIGRLIPWEFDYKYDAYVDEHLGERFAPS